MKAQLLITLLVIAMIQLNFAKRFTRCEFVQELYYKADIPRDEIYKHLCIAMVTSETASTYLDSHGIYRISSKWWCGKYEPSGKCEIECEKLIDHNIADDAVCASKILSIQGVEAWSQTEAQCKKLQYEVETCLEDYKESETWDDSNEDHDQISKAANFHGAFFILPFVLLLSLRMI
ncbi:CLUMA_CG015388, isoform A [Clunio marinus]|uniref:lysozyme n=1 Tax=Clunio marinus TaxID=568069 RepID=A0A1J1IQC4_9DIPT|nr:CLUMA_CG015388, isoform A [Clunio marinus]